MNRRNFFKKLGVGVICAPVLTKTAKAKPKPVSGPRESLMDVLSVPPEAPRLRRWVIDDDTPRGLGSWIEVAKTDTAGQIDKKKLSEAFAKMHGVEDLVK